MRKLATITGAVLLLAGVAAAGRSQASGRGNDQPVISTANPPTTTGAADVRREDRRADQRADRAKEVRGRENENVWDTTWFGSTKTLDVHVSALRRHLGDDSSDPRYLHTVRGVGFPFAAPDELR